MTSRLPTATGTLTPTALHTITPESVEAVDVVASDGLPLAGWFYHPTGSPDKPIAVILAHQLNSSSWEWRAFAELLAQNGYPVLIFDFRGQGRSPGVLDFATVGIDVEAAIRFLKSHQYDRIVCMGASMGGSGCLAAAIHHDLAGLVDLSGPMNIPGTRLVAEEELANLSIPKLFMIAEGDTIPDWPAFVSDFMEMAGESPEPKALIVYPGQAHGTALLREDFGDEVVERLLDFLSGLPPG
jgi:alpha-beta hydrolase superfamily lysophospholipase